MTFGGHITNIAREGIWASLTGGWYYEPTNSLLCNTLHLYIWSFLFILPVLFGLSINESSAVQNYGYAFTYLALLGFLFVSIKVSVAYLHHIFDTVQPIKYKTKKSTDGLQEESQQHCVYRTPFSGSSISATRATECNALETIEMVHISRSLNHLRHESEKTNNAEQQSDECKAKMEEKGIERERIEDDLASSNQLQKRKVAGFYHSLTAFGPTNRNSAPNFVDEIENADKMMTDSSNSSALASDLRSASVLPKLSNKRRKGRRSARIELGRTADSSELLPKNLPPLKQQNKKFRKLSEPIRANKSDFAHKKHTPNECDALFGQQWHSETNKEAKKLTGRTALRRNNSKGGSKTENEGSYRAASLSTKSERFGANLPGGLFVDELEMNRLSSRMERERLLKGFMDGTNSETNLPAAVFDNGKVSIENERMDQSKVTGEVICDVGFEQQEPCCSSSLFATPKALNDLQNLEKKVEENASKKNPLLSDTQSIRENAMDFVVQSANMSDTGDLKGIITKFLEELIAKHPEAMDAIESVRMNRLMKREEPTLTAGDGEDGHPEEKDKLSNGENAGSSSSHPLGIDSMDTSSGAVHAFQDEQGDWLTYWFGPNSSGTAQPFRHVPALLDKSKTNNRITIGNGSQSYNEQPTVVNVVDTSSLSAKDLERGQTKKRFSISSSSESFSSIDQPMESDKKLQTENSSSSDEAKRYILPINLVRANALHKEGTATDAEAPPNSKAQSLARGSQVSSDSSSHLTLMQRLCHLTAGEFDSTPRLVSHSRTRSERPPMVTASNVIERMEGSPFRLLNDLHMGRPLPSGLLFYHSVRDALTSRSRQKYCYRLMLPNWLNWWPFGREKETANCGDTLQRGAFTLKLDRLSLVTIFDRNSSVFSSIFDIVLALFVGLLTALMLYRRVYSEVSLLFFAFTVAGAQFSLLKSVQPDSASPVHGFNWLVAYSRPLYFVFLSSLFLFLDFTTFSAQTSVDWRPHWLRLYSNAPLHFSLQDFCAYFLLFLPLVFTLGLLPQVNTLCMHLLEQLDMHLFGATASLSIVSSVFSTCRSVLSVCVLFVVLTIVQHFSLDNISIGSVGFSAFASLTNAIAYAISRESSAHQFVSLLWNAIWRQMTTADSSPTATKTFHITQKEKQQPQMQQRPSQSTLNGPSKHLLNCCILTDHGGNSVTRRNTPMRLEKGWAKGGETKSEEEKVANGTDNEEEAEERTLDEWQAQTLVLRAQHNLFSAALRILLFFGMHRTLLFQTGQPLLQTLLSASCIFVSLFNHHIYPQMRAKNPWKFIARPIFRSHEYGQFEPTKEAKLTFFEKIHVWMVSVEKNVVYPLLVISLMTTSGMAWNSPNGPFPILVLTTCAFRLARTGYAQPNLLHIPLLATFLIHRDKFGHIVEDGSSSSVSFLAAPLFSLFVATIVWSKLSEFLLKAHFILCYVAPWQISWGSAFHAFAQPFSIPHSGLTLAQAVLSSILSAPLNPFLGSSFFLMSYIRPIKFWERDYNTNRIDHSKLRLASQLDRSPIIDDSNLNSIFYEHLTRSLQLSLAGDLLLGRWACTVQPGDCFILSSNYLNCMVHLVECGNGFVTFQLRGLEFRGTYCHQREMEAISEDWAENTATCCGCSPLESSPFLSSFLLNNAWALRWLAWEVTVAKYVVDGYSISDNSAVNMLQIHELRRLLVSLYVKCIIFYTIDSPQLFVWLADHTILAALDAVHKNPRFVDLDPVFCAANDEDFDINVGGLSRQSFVLIYAGWIEHCLRQRPNPCPLSAADCEDGCPSDVSLITSFCFVLSMLGRRALGTAAYNRHSSAAESFLFGMDALFKGDMRIAHPADEWVFADLDILNRVVSPAIRMALKLHQDHFAAVVDLDEPVELFELIEDYRKRLFISHEHDPEWRRAILANKPSLLALRHICDESQQGDYKIIMLNKRHLDMRVIKLNRECVRAFWAGQQQELIFLRNKNPERGSIQNARQVLRNIINSSADQPIGYPIYVSPLTTSFVETHNQLGDVLGPPLTINWCAMFFRSLFDRIRANFGPSGGSTTVVCSTQHQQAQHLPLHAVPPDNSAVLPPIAVAVGTTNSAHQR